MARAASSGGDDGQPVISFLSDYGTRDEFVGVCHGVIARRCPRARVIDVTHGIPRHDIRAGAIVLRGAIEYLPPGVHLAVVDPGVGASGPGARRAVALRTGAEDRLLVGPDNGLLAPAAELLGGVIEAVDIGRSPERREPVSRTFHGRDLFAPVAAALADGATLDEVGDPLDAGALAALELPRARLRGDALETEVLYRDGFGNLTLDATPEQLAALGSEPGGLLALERAGRTLAARHALAFADVAPGELLLYEDAQRMLALAVSGGSAAELLQADPGETLLVRRA